MWCLRGVSRAAFCGAFLSSGVIGCGGAPEASSPGTGGACPTLPALGPALPPTQAVSQVSLELDISSQLVEEVLGRWLPRTVAQGKMVPAGAAGRATYVVKRETPEVSVTQDGLTARVALDGDIHLCKPIGPVCIEYGHCRPKWTARARLETPWQLSEEPIIHLDVDVTKGCVLSPVKVDATAQLTKVTNGEVAKLRKQLRSELRKSHHKLLRELDRAEKKPAASSQLDAAQLSLSQRGDDYRLNVTLSGTLPSDLAPVGESPNGGRPNNDAASNWSEWLPRVTRNTRLTVTENAPASGIRTEQRVPLDLLAHYYQPRFPNQHLRVVGADRQVVAQVSPYENCTLGWVTLTPTSVAESVVFQPTLMSSPGMGQVFSTPFPASDVQHWVDVGAALGHTREPLTFRGEMLPRPLRLSFTSVPQPQRVVQVQTDALLVVEQTDAPLRAHLTFAQ